MSTSSAIERTVIDAPQPRGFWWRPWALRTALSLFALSLVVPTLLFFGLQYRAALIEKQAEFEQFARKNVHELAGNIRRELAIKRARVAALATSPSLRSGDYHAFYDQAIESVKQDYGWVSLFRSDGSRLFSTSDPYGEPANFLYGFEDDLKRIDQSKTIMDTDLIVQKQGSFAVSVLYPVGHNDLILSGGIPIEVLNNVLKTNVPDPWTGTLLDRQGKIIARSRNADQRVGKLAQAGVWQKVSAATEGRLTMKTWENEVSLASWLRLPNGWTVLVIIPKNSIEQPMRAWERQVFWNLIFFSILAVVGSIITGEWIARSISALTTAAKTIGRGEIMQPIISNLREVNDVSQAMALASREQRHIEAAMRESDMRFRAIFNQNTIGISVSDMSGRFRLVNKRHCEFTGYSESEILTKTYMDITHPDDHPETIRGIRAMLETGCSYMLEKRFIRKDGQIVWGQVSSSAVRDSDGRPKYLITVLLDINKRKRAEMANQHLASIVESSADAIMSLSLDGIILTWNHASEYLFGYTAEEAIGQSWALIIPEDRRDEIERQIVAAQNGENCRLETVRRRKDGTLVEVSLDSSPIRASDGTVIAISTISHDITERRRTEAALYEREEQFRTLANSIPQLAWMTNADGWVVWYNDRWYDYTGTTPQQMEGLGWQSVYDQTALPEVLARWNKSLASGEPFDMIFPLKGADGVYRPFLTRAMPLRDARGRIARWFGTNTDVTAQKEHEAHMNFVMRELSHRSKNLLAIVQAMARQTMQHSGDFDDFESRFMGRLHGLARSHDVLVRQDWTGAAIRDLVAAQLAPFIREDGTSLEMAGPDLMLKPDAVQNLGFALFELATNAVKYGALSVPSGKISITWNFINDDDQKHVRFNWRESGGPLVSRPERKGFGAIVIERFMAAAFGGSVSSSFPPEGFSWVLEIPAVHLLSETSKKNSAIHSIAAQ